MLAHLKRCGQWKYIWGLFEILGLGKKYFFISSFTKLKFTTCRIKKCESIIFVRSFESAGEVNQVEDKNQNWENHPGHLREGARFHCSQKIINMFDQGKMISDLMRILQNLS